MTKRIKSGLMTFIPILGAVMLTPQWVDFTKFLSDKLIAWGVPLAALALVGVILGECWKAIVNMTIINKKGLTSGDSFNDYSNELY